MGKPNLVGHVPPLACQANLEPRRSPPRGFTFGADRARLIGGTKLLWSISEQLSDLRRVR